MAVLRSSRTHWAQGCVDWFGSLGRYVVKAAAFDTRVHGPAALTGRASKGVARLLREHGFELAAEPESFLVTKQDRLKPQETARAREWGTKLAAGIAPSLARGAPELSTAEAQVPITVRGMQIGGHVGHHFSSALGHGTHG